MPLCSYGCTSQTTVCRATRLLIVPQKLRALYTFSSFRYVFTDHRVVSAEASFTQGAVPAVVTIFYNTVTTRNQTSHRTLCHKRNDL